MLDFVKYICIFIWSLFTRNVCTWFTYNLTIYLKFFKLVSLLIRSSQQMFRKLLLLSVLFVVFISFPLFFLRFKFHVISGFKGCRKGDGITVYIWFMQRLVKKSHSYNIAWSCLVSHSIFLFIEFPGSASVFWVLSNKKCNIFCMKYKVCVYIFIFVNRSMMTEPHQTPPGSWLYRSSVLWVIVFWSLMSVFIYAEYIMLHLSWTCNYQIIFSLKKTESLLHHRSLIRKVRKVFEHPLAAMMQSEDYMQGALIKYRKADKYE